eukprot:gene2527-278_t
MREIGCPKNVAFNTSCKAEIQKISGMGAPAHRTRSASSTGTFRVPAHPVNRSIRKAKNLCADGLGPAETKSRCQASDVFNDWYLKLGTMEDIRVSVTKTRSEVVQTIAAKKDEVVPDLVPHPDEQATHMQMIQQAQNYLKVDAQ